MFTDETLLSTPERATSFLAAIGAVPEIRTALEQQGGMTDDDIREGCNKLMDCLAAPAPRRQEMDTPEAKKVRGAVVEIDAWDEPNFGRAEAALRRYYSAAADYVFDDLTTSRGVESVRGVATFLTRVKALDEGSDSRRAATRAEDKKAVELLARRGITPDVRKHMQQLVDVALGPTPSLATREEADDSVRREKPQTLKLWYDDWTATARALIRKRTHLIRRGWRGGGRPRPATLARPSPSPSSSVFCAAKTSDTPAKPPDTAAKPCDTLQKLSKRERSTTWPAGWFLLLYWSPITTRKMASFTFR
jgi:hypothetical protein